ncbi:MAG: peptide/nickel transport system permease protein [Thermomicrobiales bacterium]|jgi:peptide/nickel transport system permease protein|nr:peptide/nickel transport system permease protein [Thermomicrobiales bacterium]
MVATAEAQPATGWFLRAPRALRAYPMLAVGLVLLLAVALMSVVGPLFVERERVNVGYAIPDQRPSREYLLGTDTVGRQMLAIIIYGTPLTLKIGLISGAIGLSVGMIFGLVSGYYGGFWDHLLRGAADAFLTVPGLLVLVVIATTFHGGISVTTQALVVSALAWMYPTRTIRSQVLSIRERSYVQLARFSGMNGFEIIVREIIPNLLPYLAASFVGAVSAGILASIGLEALGLGPQNEPTLGMTIYWSMYYTSILRNLWWWWAPPIVVIVVIFTGLFLISAGLDQVANPRLRNRT